MNQSKLEADIHCTCTRGAKRGKTCVSESRFFYYYYFLVEKVGRVQSNTKCRIAKPKQTRMTLETQVKIALSLSTFLFRRYRGLLLKLRKTTFIYLFFFPPLFFPFFPFLPFFFLFFSAFLALCALQSD